MANNDVFNGMSLEDAYLYADNKRNWTNGDNLQKSVSALNNQNIRNAYGITQDVPLRDVEQYIATLEDDKKKRALLTKISDNTINPNVQKAADAITNFSYDPSKDAAYKAYVDMYNRQGQSAAKQTLNNLNAANMGRNSSYSSAATAQVQQAYERLMNNYSIYKEMDDTAYNRALTGYQTLADDYTRGLTDEQLRLGNIGSEFANKASEIDLKYYEPNAQLSYDMGKLEYDDAKFNSDLNRKYAERQILADMYSGGGSSGGGSTAASKQENRAYVDRRISEFLYSPKNADGTGYWNYMNDDTHPIYAAVDKLKDKNERKNIEDSLIAYGYTYDEARKKLDEYETNVTIQTMKIEGKDWQDEDYVEERKKILFG